MGVTKKRILMNAFFKSQSSYCPLVCICYNRSLNAKIQRLHDKGALEKDNYFCILCQNIQKLAIEIYKVKDYEASITMSELFSQV